MPLLLHFLGMIWTPKSTQYSLHVDQSEALLALIKCRHVPSSKEPCIPRGYADASLKTTGLDKEQTTQHEISNHPSGYID